MADWKGVLLAGGSGSRLHPLTYAVNKHLLPVHDKPMIYYPLTTLMLAGIDDFVVVSSPAALGDLERCLGDGRKWGIKIAYFAQDEPHGIAHGLIAAEEHLLGKNVALILADNIFYGTGLPGQLRDARQTNSGATIFGYEVINLRHLASSHWTRPAILKALKKSRRRRGPTLPFLVSIFMTTPCSTSLDR
jgi:glucose-1-phosphate thymidylyltransferase